MRLCRVDSGERIEEGMRGKTVSDLESKPDLNPSKASPDRVDRSRVGT